MVLVTFRDRLLSAEARKKCSSPNQYGHIVYGVSRYGHFNNFAGIYQTRRLYVPTPNQYGYIIYGVSRYGQKQDKSAIDGFLPRPSGRVHVRKVFYVPSNPQTAEQQANRSKFADAVSAWQALTAGQKEVYRLKSSGKHMSGYNVFLREYLISN